MTQLVRASNLSFGWRKAGGDWFHQLNLNLESGHIYGLLGRNGAGKTTLIRLLTGGLAPQQGQVMVSAISGKQVPAFARRPEALANMVYVPESADLPPLTASQFAAAAGKLYPRFSLSQFHEFLGAFDVPQNKTLASLSFGQKRKAHIAFAFATNANIVYLDEPTNGLDVMAQMALRQIIVKLVADERTIVVSTHHLREFETVIDRIILLDRGNVVANEDLDNVRLQPGFEDLEKWYAGKIGVEGAAHANI
jgi:ABC-2 type transport system ATP-binding protein